MIKVGTIGMIADNKKNFPTVQAHADILNGYICTVAAGKTVAPVAGISGTPQTADLYIVMNTVNGDDSYTDATIAKDDYANAFLLKQWDGQTLVLDEGHITYGAGEDYSDITAGTTKLTVGTDGKLAINATTTDYGMYFLVTKKVNFCGNGVEVKIVVA